MAEKERTTPRATKRLTASQIFALCLLLTHVVDMAVGRVIPSKLVLTLEELDAAPLVLEIKYFCSSASRPPTCYNQ